MVVAEAMAAGTPVIATRVGGIPEMIDHGRSGYLFEPGDVGALTSQLRFLLENPEAAQKMGQEAAAAAREQNSPERVGRQTVSLYRQLLQVAP